jgi:crotonobetainyl-CoA hydratase
VSAEEGKSLGFVNEIVAPGEALAAAKRWAQQILECAPIAIRASKEAVYRGLDAATLEEALRTVYPTQDLNIRSEDYIEGPSAFSEKRKPVWKNR